MQAVLSQCTTNVCINSTPRLSLFWCLFSLTFGHDASNACANRAVLGPRPHMYCAARGVVVNIYDLRMRLITTALFWCCIYAPLLASYAQSPIGRGDLFGLGCSAIPSIPMNHLALHRRAHVAGGNKKSKTDCLVSAASSPHGAGL